MSTWSAEELKFLKENYSDKGGRFCADHLNRTIKSVSDKARRSGLSVTNPCKSRRRTHEQYIKEILPSGCEPLEPYTVKTVPILHKCKKGHIWKTSPASLLRGSGCPSCAKYGFNPTMPAILYFVSFEANNEIYYKLGITNKSVPQRFAGDWVKFKMKIVWSIDLSTGKEAKELESKLLRTVIKYNTHLLLRGNTETTRQYIEKPVLR